MLMIFALFWNNANGSAIWSSGVIYPSISDSSDSSYFNSYILKPIQALTTTPKYESERDNFVLALIPNPTKTVGRFEVFRTLFVSPEIAESNPIGVKETFVRLFCNMVGILFDLKELEKLEGGRGGYFSFTRRPVDLLIECLNRFEIKMGIKVNLAMINAGPDVFDFSSRNEFRRRNFLLYKHPLHIEGSDLLYADLNILMGNCEMLLSPSSWLRNVKYKSNFDGPIYYKIIRNYSIEQRTDCEIPEPADAAEIINRMEDIYGPLDEIPLTARGAEKADDGEGDGDLSSSEDENFENKADEEEYEIIFKEDLDGYRKQQGPFKLL